MSSVSYHLLLQPEQDELVALVHRIAAELMGLDPAKWSEPVEEEASGTSSRTVWAASQGAATLRLCAPAAQGATSSWLELTGFPNGGRVRWELTEPPTLRIQNLEEDALDTVWGMMRAQQAEAVRAWVRTRGAKHATAGRGNFKQLLSALRPMSGTPRLAAELPRIAQPPFVSDKFPEWLYKGELSSLPRRVEAVGAAVAGIALESAPERRLLVRPLQRMGSQSIVPVVHMTRGHAFAGPGSVGKTFASADALIANVYPTVTRLSGIALSKAPVARRRETKPQVVFISRFTELEHNVTQSFAVSAAVEKNKDLTVRVLEATTAFAADGDDEGIIELEVDGLPGDVQLFVVGRKRRDGEYKVRLFTIGPRAEAEEIATVFEPLFEAVSTPPKVF